MFGPPAMRSSASARAPAARSSASLFLSALNACCGGSKLSNAALASRVSAEVDYGQHGPDNADILRKLADARVPQLRQRLNVRLAAQGPRTTEVRDRKTGRI